MDALTREYEARRVQALRKFAILDTSPEQGYDDIVFLATLICDTPIAMINMVDSERGWFKAKAGVDIAEIPLEESFCIHAIEHPDLPFIVEDTHADARFADSKWVKSEPGIRFYAGVPLVAREGYAIGTICVMDSRPRTLSQDQLRALEMLARQTIAHMESERRVAALQEAELRFRAFMDNSPVLASLKDDLGRYLYVNRPFLERCGLPDSDILGKTDAELWPDDIARRIRKSDLAVMAAGQPLSEIETTTSADGRKSYWQITRFMLDGQRRLLGGMGLDITKAKCYEEQLVRYQEELQRTLERLEVLSVTDALTELCNRRAFNDRLKEEFERARRYNLPLSLLLIDVDNFKTFNDSMGHTEGDGLLHDIAAILKENARANDITARYGGDEFAVILPNTNARVAFSLAERLRWNARGLACEPFQITLSIGVAQLSSRMGDRGELVVAADQALYDAKRKGRNQVSCLI